MARRRFSLDRARQSPFELWVAIVAIVNVVAYFTREDANPVHELVAPWDTVWAVTYAIAGVLMAVGLLRERSANLEAAGLLLLLGGLLVQLLVFASLGVATLTGTWGTLVNLGSLTVITVWRVRTLVRASRNIGDERAGS